ncbi:decarboxylating 6-phosphogluconate dehydrogenase [Georgenia halophila]|uniref:Decarboxylating 6-phosphogluconate dehydrogenase n=1 Tax=Georgenia halophila TaxID=620889 RepID=A0ABP8L9P8_9MICO
MHIGMVGLGRMGGNMMERLRAAGITVTGYDANPENSEVPTLSEFVATLPQPRRAIWIMVPAGDPTTAVLNELAGLLDEGDVVVEGGNSHFERDQENAAMLFEKGIRYVDVGVSGGIWGRDNGYGLMAGGDQEDIEHLLPVFDALRPEGPREEGFVHAGPVGAGHYSKMVHNGIEYGLMQAYAEGYQLLEARDDLIPDVGAVFGAWRRGTVVRSWLLDLMVRAVKEDPGLDDIRGWVEDSGEGRWTIVEAIDGAVPVPVISGALFARFSSRQPNSPAMRAVAALRKQFGGHAVRSAEEQGAAGTPDPAASDE